MLPFATGREQVKNFLAKEPTKARFQPALDKLPRQLRELAHACLDLRLANRELYGDDEAPGTVAELLTLSPKQLRQVFDVLFGELGEAAVSTWLSLRTGPYGSFFGSATLFRSSGSDQLHSKRQFEWLGEMISVFLEIDPAIATAEKLAVWAPYLDRLEDPVFVMSWDGTSRRDHIGRLLATIIDSSGRSGENVFDTLRLALEGRHPQSMFGGHVFRAFWRCHRPEAHELLEDYFVTTSNSKHRHAIIRGATEGDRSVHQRLLARALESGLLDDMNVLAELLPWLGFTCRATEVQEVKDLLGLALQALSAPSAEEVWVEGPDWLCMLFRAWRQALDDVPQAFGTLERLLHSDETTARWSATELLIATQHPGAAALLETCITDTDLQLAVTALHAINQDIFQAHVKSTPHDAGQRVGAAAALYRQIKQLPEKPEWLDQRTEHNLVSSVENELRRSWTNQSLAIIADCIDSGLRLEALPAEYIPPDAESVTVLLRYVKDAKERLGHGDAISPALQFLLRSALSESDWLEILKLVHERQQRLKPSIVEALKQEPVEKVSNVLRLLMTGAKADERILVMKLVYELADSAHASACQAMLPLLSQPLKRSRYEIELLARTTDRLKTTASPSIADTLARRLFPDLPTSPPWQPQPRGPARLTEAGIRFIESLDAFVADNEARIMQAAEQATGLRPATLADVKLRAHDRSPTDTALDPIWQEWYVSREPQTRDSDGRELVRVATCWEEIHTQHDRIWSDWQARSLDLSAFDELISLRAEDMPSLQQQWARTSPPNYSPFQRTALQRFDAVQHKGLVWSIVRALFALNADWDDFAFQLDVAESLCAAVPEDAIKQPSTGDGTTSQGVYLNPFSYTLRISEWLRRPERLALESMPPELLQRQVQLERWVQKPHPAMLPLRTSLDEELLEAYGKGAATLGDIAERMLVENPSHPSPCLRFEDIERLKHRYPEKADAMLGFLDRLASTIIESEANRPPAAVTPLTPFAVRIGYLEGFKHFESMLLASAGRELVAPTDNITNYRSVLSRLISAIFPSAKDSHRAAAKRLSELLKNKQIEPVHLLRAGFLAPQWLDAIGAALGWKELRNLHAWLHTHTPGSSSRRSPELAAWLAEDNRQLRQSRQAPVNEEEIDDWFREKMLDAYPRLRQYLDRDLFEELKDAAARWVEVDWFHDVAKSYDDKKWELIAEAASVLSTPKAVAAVLALVDAIRGKSNRKRKTLLSEIKATKKPIDIRPIALMPLASGAARNSDLLERYRAIEEYRTKAKKFYDEDKSTALEMVQNTLKLLAHTAGLASVEQLNWLVAASASDEFVQQESVVIKDFESRLTIDPTGAPVSTFTKAGKRVKTAPDAIKKNSRFQAQQDLLKSLQKFAKEARRALEAAMVDRQIYKPADLEKMLDHPLLRAMFQALIFTDGQRVGLLDEGGKTWTDSSGKKSKLPARSQLRIAHPLDLVRHGGWMHWRDVLAERGITQPFAQVERGIFLPEHFSTAAASASESGLREPLLPHWIADDQATAILRTRGWEDRYHTGPHRSFTCDNIQATVQFERPTLLRPAYRIQSVSFQPLGSHDAPPLERVPAIVFSETLRDLYTAALGARTEEHLPDESVQWCEARKRALTQLIQTRRLANVRWDDTRLVIDGIIGSAMVDLLNADVRLLPMQRIPLEYFSLDEEQSSTELESPAADPHLNRLLAAVDQLAGDPSALSDSLRSLLGGQESL